MILEHFKKKMYKPVSNVNIQPDILVKCSECSNMFFKNDLSENFKICPTCGK